MASSSSRTSNLKQDSATSEAKKKTRVAIVGAGAAGSSCAYALSRHPDRYDVTVFDKEKVAGGMASSLDIDASK